MFLQQVLGLQLSSYKGAELVILKHVLSTHLTKMWGQNVLYFPLYHDSFGLLYLYCVVLNNSSVKMKKWVRHR